MPEVIVYPPNLDTNEKKLFALYPIHEHFRLKHNQEGARVKTNPELKSGWYLYSQKLNRLGGNEFWNRRMPLLREQNRLRDAIRRAAYTDREWRDLSEDKQNQAFRQLFGDKKQIVKGLALKDKTEATSPLFDDLKTISLEGLVGIIPPDPYEDFTTFTEGDPDTYIAVTSSRITVTAVPGDVEAYVYKAHAIAGDFEHKCGISIGTMEADTGARLLFWAVSNQHESIGDMIDAGEGILAVGVGPDAVDFYLRDYAAATSDVDYNLGAGTFWLKASRASTTGVLVEYSDEFSTEVDTLTLTCTTDSYTHIYGVASYGYGDSDDLATGYLEELDLQEAAAPSFIPNFIGVI